MEVGADQNFHTSCTLVLRNLHGQLVLRFNSPASNLGTNFSHFCMVLTSPLQPHHLLQGKWRWNQKVNNACLNIKWQVSNLLDPSSLVSRHQQLLQCTWLFRQHPWYTPLPCYQPMSKPRQYYFNAAAYWKKVFTVQLPPLGFPPGPLHSNTRPHTCWTVGELCGGRALPPTLPTDSGDLSPSRLRWPCPQNFCTTRSPFHIIPCFTHRGQGSLFFGIRGETYCLNTHFLKPIS